MSIVKDDNFFLGAGWSFPPEFNKSTADATMVSGVTDIDQSLKILFSTFSGERIMVPEYGCKLVEFLFEDIDSTLISQISDKITNAILYFEPRINLIDVDIDTTQYLDGVIYIRLDYVIKQTNSRNNSVYPYYLNEGNLLNRPEIM
jgi:hypothetical protein